MHLIDLSCLLLVCLATSVHSNPVEVLANQIFNGYNNLVSPYVVEGNGSSSLIVYISITQAIVASMNERDWTVSVLTTMNYGWTDDRLRWDPSLFGGITRIAVKSGAVWQPDVFPCESSAVTNVLPDAKSAKIEYTGEVLHDMYQMITFNCPMNFDAFPFDKQNCLLCFALEGFTGTTISLVDISSDRPELLGNSEWRFFGNMTMVQRILAKNGGVSRNQIGYHFSMARRSFFWITLIILPTMLICVVALIGIFFAGEDRIVENAITIGLTTMTSLMLVVTILADSLAKADNLPGLGWFVLIDIGIVCAAAVAVIMADNLRSLAIAHSRGSKEEKKKKGGAHFADFLLLKRNFRIARILLFLLSIFGLVLNMGLDWAIARSAVLPYALPFLDRNTRPPGPPPISP